MALMHERRLCIGEAMENTGERDYIGQNLSLFFYYLGYGEGVLFCETILID